MAAARRRVGRNAHLPPNLYRNGKSFQWRDPRTGKVQTWTIPEDAAIRKAKAANARLVVRQPASRAHDSVAYLLAEYKRELADLAPSTLRERARLIDLYRASPLGKVTLPEIGRLELRAAWKNRSPAAQKQHRNLWVMFLDWAVEAGYVDENEARRTKKPKPQPRQRSRLTLEQFDAIRALADPWFARVMDVALASGLRRTDLTQLRRADVHDGALHVTTSKTGTPLRFPLHGALGDAVSACMASPVINPYLLHRMAREPLKPGLLSNTFARLRDRAGIEGPTFHEIRALSVHLLEQRGYTPEQIKTFTGHADVRMVGHYADGHTQWQDVEVGL